MKHLFRLLFLFAAFVVQTAWAQKLTIESFAQSATDITASTEARQDGNGDACALVKVRLALVGATFEGAIRGDVVNHNGEYWVYMLAGSKRLMVKQATVLPLEVNFASHGVNGVEGKKTYVLTLLTPQTGSPSQDDGLRFLSMTVKPTNATVMIDYGQVPVREDGTLMLPMAQGQHTYTVSAFGYASQKDTITISDQKVSLKVTLEPLLTQLTVSCPTEGAAIYINEEKKSDNNSWSGTLSPSTYVIEARKTGYITQRQVVTLQQDKPQSISLPALIAPMGTLSVSYSPEDAEVWLDGKKLGTSPDIFRNIMAGTHQVELRKEGYQPVSQRVTIEEGKTATLSGSLVQTTTAAQSAAVQPSSSMPDPAMDEQQTSQNSDQNKKLLETIEKIEFAENDKFIDLEGRKDLDGHYCSIIRVQLPLHDVQCEGDIIGPIKNEPGEMRLYVSHNSKKIRISQKQLGSFDVVFADYGINQLKERSVYELKITPKNVLSPTLSDVSFELCKNNDYAITNPRRDLNDDYCALVLVSLPSLQGVVFDGEIVGTIANKNGEYWVYMTNGSRYLKIKHSSIIPLTIKFSDFGVTALESKKTYRLNIDAPKSANDYLQSFTVNSVSSATDATAPIDASSLYQEGMKYFEGRGGLQDYKKAISYFKKAAKNGDAEGLYQLGVCFHQGLGTKQNYSEALKYYKQAAERGHVLAQFNVGCFYEQGYGVKVDYSEAAIWLSKAAKQGLDQAINEFNVCYHNGISQQVSMADIVNWHRMGTEMANAEAYYNLGFCYESGFGVTRDMDEAVRLYRRGANLGNTDSTTALSRLGKPLNSRGPIVSSFFGRKAK